MAKRIQSTRKMPQSLPYVLLSQIHCFVFFFFLNMRMLPQLGVRNYEVLTRRSTMKDQASPTGYIFKYLRMEELNLYSLKMVSTGNSYFILSDIFIKTKLEQ